MKHSLNILIQYLYKPEYLLFIFVIAGKGQKSLKIIKGIIKSGG